MLAIRLVALPAQEPAVLAVPVSTGGTVLDGVPLAAGLRAEIEAFQADHARGDATPRPTEAGGTRVLPRPLGTPRSVLLVGVGDGAEAGWRAAGAALVRAAKRERVATLAIPPGADPAAVRGAAEGALLAGYRFRLAAQDPPGDDNGARRLGEVSFAVDDPARFAAALAHAEAVARATLFARDLANMPSQTKSPAWFADEVRRRAAQVGGLTVTVREPETLAAEGFGGLLAVGGGSVRGPRLVELAWQPAAAGGPVPHVVLVGKGITFDSGGIDLKTREGMKLMRKDMSGAAAVTAAAIGAAALRLPVRVTALAPLAENMPGGSAYRPADVVRHYGGMTSEIRNTDAEGRVVLADALAYAATMAPDALVDLATLTGAANVALGKRTAALYSDSDELADALAAAAEAAGERVWRMPLVDEYRDALDGEVADLSNSTDIGAGSILAALFLREFTGAARGRWAHLDMSAPAWSDSVDGELGKGATGWGVRTLLRWLSQLG